MKNILITTGGLSSVGQGGGISSYTHDLAENFAKAGHNVTVFLIKENATSAPENVTYKYQFFEIGDTLEKEEQTIIKVLNAIESLNPDVIINNDTAYVVGLWPVLKKEILKISVMHGFSKRLSLHNAGISGKMATVNHEYADYIICQNTRMVKDVAKKYNIPADKLVFIPQSAEQGILLEKPSNDLFTIIFAGGSSKSKGAIEMYKCAKLLQKSSLNFRIKWCLNAEKYENEFANDKRFQFLGNLTRDHFTQELQSSDCIIIPTHLDTGPMLLVEAMGQDVIPVCNNLQESAIPDIVKNDKNGILIEGNNPTEFFEKVSQLISDKQYRLKLQTGTSAYFIENLTKAKQLKRFEKLFDNKKCVLPKQEFSNKNIIYYHLKKTSHLPKYSLKRIRSKIINALEIPKYKK